MTCRCRNCTATVKVLERRVVKEVKGAINCPYSYDVMRCCGCEQVNDCKEGF